MLIKLRKAQNTAEYAIVLGLVVGAIVAMQVYVKRGLQGRFKQAVDKYNNTSIIDGWGGVDYSKQYEPYYLESDFTVNRTSTGFGDIDTAESAGWYAERGTEDWINRTAGYQRYKYNASEGDFYLNETDTP